MKNKFCLIVLLFISQMLHAQLLDSVALDTVKVYDNIEEALKNPDKVYKLILKKEKLNAIPTEIFQLKNLQYLVLKRNRIKKIPSEIVKLQYLQYFDISWNRIDSIPIEIGQLKYLKEIHFGQNDLWELPKEIADLENLEVLDIWSNNISSLPESIGKLKKIRIVDMRAIQLNPQQQEEIQQLLPNVEIFFSPSCNCN